LATSGGWQRAGAAAIVAAQAILGAQSQKALLVLSDAPHGVAGQAIGRGEVAHRGNRARPIPVFARSRTAGSACATTASKSPTRELNDYGLKVHRFDSEWNSAVSAKAD